MRVAFFLLWLVVGIGLSYSARADDLTCQPFVDNNPLSGRQLNGCFGPPFAIILKADSALDPNGNARWRAFAPDGTIQCDSDNSATTTSCFNEAVAFAQNKGYAFILTGGGGNPNGNLQRVTLPFSTPLIFPVGRGQDYTCSGINLLWTGGAQDAVVVDTLDFTQIDFRNCLTIYYHNNADNAAWRINPQHDNGESFAGLTSSYINVGNIAVTGPGPGYLPDSTHGIGLRISAPALGLGLTSGNGIVTNTKIEIPEINAGKIGVQVDDPGGSGSVFSENTIFAPAIHAQSQWGMKLGMTSAATGRCYRNTFFVTIHATPGIDTWCGDDVNGGDSFYGELVFSTGTGVQLEQTAAHNAFYGQIIATTPFAGSPTSNTNQRFDATIHQTSTIGLGPSTFTYKNTYMMPIDVIVSGGTVSDIQISSDATTFTDIGAPASANQVYHLLASGALKVTYSAPPTMLALH